MATMHRTFGLALVLAAAHLGVTALRGEVASAPAEKRELATLMSRLWKRSYVPPSTRPASAPAPLAPAALAPQPASVPGSGSTTSMLRLSLAEYLRQVRWQNDQIVSQRLEFEISEQGIAFQKAIFEAQFTGTGIHEENQIKNTVEQALQRTSQSEFLEFNERWDAAFEKLLPTGTKLRVGYHLDDLNNSLQRLVPGGDSFNEFRSFAGVTVTQPVLRNAGRRAMGAKIRIAEKDREIAFQVYRREMLRILAEAAAAYWELAKDQARMVIFAKSVRIAERLVELNAKRVKSGLIPEGDLLEAQVGLSLRRSQENEARRDLARAMNRVRTFLYRTPLQDGRTIQTTEKLTAEKVTPDLASHLERAFAHAPEYQIARIKAVREGLKEGVAKNAKRPQLDLKSAYGVNGLDTTASSSIEDAFTTNHPTWSVSFELKVPLQGNQQATADLESARRKTQEALIEIRNTEIELANSLDTGIKSVQLTAGQMAEHEGMVATREQLLGTEIERLDKGISTSRIVLQRDDDLNRILEDQLEAAVSHEKAVLAFEVTRGTLLERFGLDVSRPKF